MLAPKSNIIQKPFEVGIIEQNAGLFIFSKVPNIIVERAVTAPVFPADKDISVSPFSKQFLSYWFVYLVPQTISYISLILLGGRDFTTLIILIVLISSIYIINDYSFLSVLESNYASFGKFINIMKLDRKSDRMNYSLSFKERDTDKKCVIEGVWDKTAQPANISGDMEGCNPDNLGKNLGIIM